MARKIYIKDGGLNRSSTIPPGYTALGSDSGELKIKVSDGISGSSKIRVDVVSLGVRANTISSKTRTIIERDGWTNLLWEIIDSNGNYLLQDKIYTLDTDLVTDVEIYTIEQGFNITLKGYYYLNQSKEKFRIVGRNLAYWSLVGINNYARMRDRTEISPGDLGLNIITSLQTYSINIGYESLSYITTDGKGFVFSHLKGNRICKSLQQNDDTLTFNAELTHIINSRIDKDYNTHGIDDSGNLVPLFDEIYVDCQADSELYLGCNKVGGIDSIQTSFSDIDTVNNSLLQFYKIKVITENYPNGLTVWYVRPIGQDIFLLNNNTSKLSDDNVYLIPESKYNSTFLPDTINLYTYLDDTDFGKDVSNDDTRTEIDRYRNIRVEDIPSFKEASNVLNKFVGKSIKYKVAYGKLGNYTSSDDYILIKSNGICYTALVNK
jgi:hypothetical protein